MGLYGDNGKENGNYYNRVYIRVILGLYGDNGKENGNFLLSSPDPTPQKNPTRLHMILERGDGTGPRRSTMSLRL